MFETHRQWLRFYCNAKYDDSFVARVFRKMYASYLKRNGYEDIRGILK